MNHILLRLSLLVLAIVFAYPASAQNLYVGSNSSNQTNNITSGYNSYNNTYIGYNPNDSNNTLNVLGSNTVLINSIYYLWVGYSGSYNRLIISNGGSAYSYYGAIGGGYSNSVLVTGKGSLWSNSLDMEVGSGGQGKCSLVVSNGGVVDSFFSNNSGIITIGLGSPSNSVLVTGVGSELNTGSLNLGNGSGNSLVISKGAVVTSQNTEIGLVEADVGYTNASSNNSVLVTGAGSLWTNSGTIYVGYGGRVGGGGIGSGTLTIGTGATVAASNILIASQSNSEGTLNFGTPGGRDTNVSLITQSISFGSGVGTINFNQSNNMTIFLPISGNGSINQLGRGATILTGSNSFSDSIVVSSGSLQLGNNGTTVLYLGNGVGDSDNLLLTGGLLNNNYTIIGNSSNSTGSATVSDGTWSNKGSLTIGNSGTGSLTIGSNGVVKTSGVSFAKNYGSVGTINFGTLGGYDTNVSLITPSISFGSQEAGSGTGTLNFSQSDTATITSTISGYGNLRINQLGQGTTILNTSSRFSGSVSVNDGTLLIPSTGVILGEVDTTVDSGGILQNDGIVSGATYVSGTLSGTGGGFDYLQPEGSSSLIWNINSFTGTAGTNWDFLNAFTLDLSALSATNPVTIHVQGVSGSGSTNAPAYYTFNFLNVSNSVTEFDPSDFIIDSSLFTNTLGISGGSWGVATNATSSGEQVTLIYTVPEPSSIFLLGMGLGVAVLAFEMKRKIKRRDGISNAMNFSDGGGPL